MSFQNVFQPNFLSSWAKRSSSEVFRRGSFSNILSTTSNIGDLGREKAISAFVQDYRTLPLIVRAHLENWAIKVDQLKSDDPQQGPTAASERRRTAKYHGIDVEVETCKIYDSDSCESLRLRNEITALAQSRHPNIIGFLGAGFCGDCCLVV